MNIMRDLYKTVYTCVTQFIIKGRIACVLSTTVLICDKTLLVGVRSERQGFFAYL